jgi:hypothetical protein
MANILERWGLTVDQLTEVVDSNPSLRGVMLGYLGEFKLRQVLESTKKVQDLKKADDHDRKNKNDLALTYKDYRFTIEAKSLQTNSVKVDEAGGKKSYRGNFQCDASDCREIELPNGKKLETTCLVAGDFDIVAVNLFAFRQKWEFGFCLNSDLPRSKSKKYSDEQKKYLLATLPKITLPLEPPYTDDIFKLLDKLVEERNKGVPHAAVKVVAEAEPEEDQPPFAKVEVEVKK